jgi:hypothetical protein
MYQPSTIRAAIGLEVADPTYIPNLCVVSTPCVRQLPFAILLIPHLQSVIGRGCDNAVPIEIKFGDGDQITMAGVKISKASPHVTGTRWLRPDL